MSETTSNNHISITRLIFIPSVITLAITVLRLVGELQHWSETLFNPEPGGPGSIIGITWLAPIFGVYFALKLSGAGAGPASAGRAILYAVIGLIVMFAGGILGFSLSGLFPGQLFVGLLIIAASALILFPAWPALFKVLIAYAYAARIPVTILMYFAIRGQWGTHYDVVPPNFPSDKGFLETFMLIGFLPQMIFWIAFTVVIGALFGSIATALLRRKPAAQAAGAA